MADQSVAALHLTITIDTQLRLALFNLAMAAKHFLDVSHEFDGDHRYVDSEFFAALDERTKEALEVLAGLPSGRMRLSEQLRDRLRVTFAKLRAEHNEMLVDAVSGEYQRGLDDGALAERKLADIRQEHDAKAEAPPTALETRTDIPYDGMTAAANACRNCSTKLPPEWNVESIGWDAFRNEIPRYRLCCCMCGQHTNWTGDWKGLLDWWNSNNPALPNGDKRPPAVREG